MSLRRVVGHSCGSTRGQSKGRTLPQTDPCSDALQGFQLLLKDATTVVIGPGIGLDLTKRPNLGPRNRKLGQDSELAHDDLWKGFCLGKGSVFVVVF